MRLLVTGAWKDARKYSEEIEKLGHTVVFLQNECDNLPCGYEEIEGIICNGLFLHHKIEKFESLKYIQLTSAGFDRVPLEYVKYHGIEIRNARGVYSVPISEFAVCGVLSLYKKIRFFYDNQKAHIWEKNREVFELFGKTVCIVGCGSIGQECAKRFAAFGCRVIGVDLYPSEDKIYQKIYPVSLIDEALGESDIVILTLPLTDTTEHLMDGARFSAMKNGSVLVNVSRGEIICTDLLIKALKDKHLFGAVLDVFEKEPLETESSLYDMDNVIITPHNSFVGDGNGERLFRVILENLISLDSRK